MNDVIREQMKALLARPELSANDKKPPRRALSSDSRSRGQDGYGLPGRGPGQIDDNNLDQVVSARCDIIAMAPSACGKSHAASLCIGGGNDQTQYIIDSVKFRRYHHHLAACAATTRRR